MRDTARSHFFLSTSVHSKVGRMSDFYAASGSIYRFPSPLFFLLLRRQIRSGNEKSHLREVGCCVNSDGARCKREDMQGSAIGIVFLDPTPRHNLGKSQERSLSQIPIPTTTTMDAEHFTSNNLSFPKKKCGAYICYSRQAID